MNTFQKISAATLALSISFGVAIKDAFAKVGDKIGTALLDGSETKKLIDKFGGTNKDLTVAIYNIITIVLSFLGVLFVIMIIYAGFLWMMDSGESKNTEKATKILYNSVIGLIIIVAAYIITYFVVQSVGTAVTGSVNKL
jgi:drug/metabolite transporter (DMT)-like permease